MQDLFGNHTGIGDTYLAQWRDEASHFSRWLAEAYRSGILDLVVEGLIKSGIASGSDMALRFLALHSEMIDIPDNPLLCLGDFKSTSVAFSGAQQFLRSYVGVERSVWHVSGIARRLGSFSHTSTYALLRRHFAVNRELCMQLDLFTDPQCILPFFAKEAAHFSSVSLTDDRGFLDRTFLSDMLACANEVIAAERTQRTWSAAYEISFRALMQLVAMFVPLVGSRQIVKFLSDSAYERWLLGLALATLAKLLGVAQKERYPRILFDEVSSVRNERFGMNGGRIDYLEVCEIDGKRPNRTQRRILERIATEAKRKSYSAGMIIHSIAAHIVSGGGPHEVSVLLTDKKFWIGDGARKQGAILSSGDLNGRPIKSHGEQMKRYLSAIWHDTGSLMQYDMLPRWWAQGMHFCGAIDYHLGKDTRTYEVLLDAREQEEYFPSIAADVRARERAVLRIFGGRLVNRAVDEIKQRTGMAHVSVKNRISGLEPAMPLLL